MGEQSAESTMGPSLIDLVIARSAGRRYEPQPMASTSKTLDIQENSEEITHVSKTETRLTSAHSSQELWKWTMTSDAIASCFVKDALQMRECDDKGVEFFWLGRVPCRTVRIVGIIVGVQTYEKKTVYAVDDGTGVIDCNHRHPNTSTMLDGKIPSALGNSNQLKFSEPPILQIPKPVADIGMSVRVVGRVLKWHDTRVLTTNHIIPCLSSNDEAKHWLDVCNLHRTKYFVPSVEPFTLPPPIQSTQPLKFKITNASSRRSETTAENAASTLPPDPRTPSRSSVTSSTQSSPISTASSADGPQSPIRLRHPSRLHTRDVTPNTLRIYIKHYMDNAAAEQEQRFSSDDESDYSHSGQAFSKTPTRPRVQLHPGFGTEATPRPSQWVSASMLTPRARPSSAMNDNEVADESADGIRGYTLSHLRRVPELQLLARRVVREEAKRRAREERAKAKESQSQHKTKPPSLVVPSSGSRGPSRGKEAEPIGLKMKRLFQFAIRQLFEDGSIVLWDGPARALPNSQDTDTVPSLLSFGGVGRNRLWKGDGLMFSGVSGTSQIADTNDSGELSDPTSDEESYIPLTTAYLSKIIEETITEIMSLSTRASASNICKSWNVSVTSRSIQRAGPTPSEILGRLQKDDRWARVGEWSIKEALEWSKDRGRVWCVGDGRWELCG